MGNTLGKSGERRGVMLEFEDACQDLFAQLVADAPQWTEWMEQIDGSEEREITLTQR
jgi:hypothetical protein